MVKRDVPRNGIGVIFSSSLLLIACLAFLGLAQGTERAGDAVFVDSFQQHATAAVALESETLFQIEIAADEERFDLYRIYNQFLGTWLEVELLQAQLAVAAEADSAGEEEARADLRDQAQFVLSELKKTEEDLERNIPALTRPDHLRMNHSIRQLLFEVRATIDRLLSEQCARLPCATGP